MHGRADGLDSESHQRVQIVIHRVAEGRDEDHLAGRPGLVMVVHELRVPLDEKLPVHVGGFRHVRGERIAIVVVADVFVVEAGQAVHGAPGLVLFAHVPVGHQLLPVGIRRHAQDNIVVQQAQGLGVVAGQHLIRHLEKLLREALSDAGRMPKKLYASASSPLA